MDRVALVVGDHRFLAAPDHGRGPLQLPGGERQQVLDGQVFAKGLCLHAHTELVYGLDGKYKDFKAVLGMDDPWRYRIRGEFEAVGAAGTLRFGFHRMRSHSVLPIDSCLIHDERIENALPAFARAANEFHLEGLQNLLLTVEPRGRGLLWRLRFHGPEPAWPRAELAHRVAELLPEVALLDDAMTLEFWDLTFRVRSDTFVQTNYRQMLVLYRSALDMLAPQSGERILDLYAGIGNLSVVAARDSAGIRLGADRRVYVSCEPSTHARDVAGLVRGGYRVRRAAIVDMFPQTYHIESVALLERR